MRNSHEEAEPRWLILQNRSTEQPGIVSVISSLPSEEAKSRFPLSMKVLWGYESLSNGMPTEKEIIYARHIEDELAKIIKGHGVHVMNKTGGGGRTFYYYVSSIEELNEAIARFFDGEPPISIKIVVERDEKWVTVRDVLDAIQ